jgi:hypothetical protein
VVRARDLEIWKWHKTMQIALPRLFASLVYDVSSRIYVCLDCVFDHLPNGSYMCTCLLPTAWKVSGLWGHHCSLLSCFSTFFAFFSLAVSLPVLHMWIYHVEMSLSVFQTCSLTVQGCMLVFCYFSFLVL